MAILLAGCSDRGAGVGAGSSPVPSFSPSPRPTPSPVEVARHSGLSLGIAVDPPNPQAGDAVRVVVHGESVSGTIVALDIDFADGHKNGSHVLDGCPLREPGDPAVVGAPENKDFEFPHTWTRPGRYRVTARGKVGPLCDEIVTPGEAEVTLELTVTGEEQPAAPVPDGWQRCGDASQPGGWSIAYPSNWERAGGRNTDDCQWFRPSPLSYRVDQQEPPFAWVSLRSHVDYPENLDLRFRDATDKRKTRVAGYSAVRYEWEETMHRPSGRQVSYVIDVDGSGWVVETHDEWASAQEFAEAVRILDTAVTTLTIG